MQRRKFLQQLAWLGGGLVAAIQLPAQNLFTRDGKISGRVKSGKKGLANVVVSDGYSVVATDAKGNYEIDLHPAARSVFVSTPAGYAFLHEDHVARHYHTVDGKRTHSLDFDLRELRRSDDEHQFIIWADPQVKSDKDVQKMLEESVPDVQKLVKAAGKDTLLHGITVGDIVWDESKHFDDYTRAVGKMGIPFFQCLGNHDMDYNKGGDETSDTTFQQHYGPTFYSFNRGQVHYVVMDNVRYLGKDREYDGFFQQHQLDWLKKDLSFVPEDKLIVLCVHIPVHNGVKNNADLYAILGNRKVHIMSGHTHYHRNVIKGNIYEHNHGTVCGAWWTGPICGDGTPCGYGVYKVKGTDIQWHYQATGESSDYQMALFIQEKEGTKELLANIWNADPAWKTTYWVDGVEKGSLQQFTGFDPLAYSTLLGPELPKPRGFAEPKKTEHLFRAVLPAGAREVKVVATDRFGKEFTSTREVPA